LPAWSPCRAGRMNPHSPAPSEQESSACRTRGWRGGAPGMVGWRPITDRVMELQPLPTLLKQGKRYRRLQRRAVAGPSRCGTICLGRGGGSTGSQLAKLQNHFDCAGSAPSAPALQRVQGRKGRKLRHVRELGPCVQCGLDPCARLALTDSRLQPLQPLHSNPPATDLRIFNRLCGSPAP
jgi:hypothetical protein